MGPALLEVRGLTKTYPVATGHVFNRKTMRAVDDVSFDVRAGETLAVVGESGCGKSTMARMASGLLPPTSGSIRYQGEEIAGLRGKRLFALRRRVQMVFQDPMASLNARMKVGTILEEPLIIHRHGDAAARRKRVDELLDLVGLRPEYARRYPHQFSGGQKQRIGIARALAVEPSLLVLDEPVSALDVSVQAQIINLLKDLQARLGLAYVFIAHDLAVVRHMADQVAVMYLGRVVERGDRKALFDAPGHPYTRMLVSAVPRVGSLTAARKREILGEMPSPIDPPPGCHFHPRCPFAVERCRREPPALADRVDREIACHRANELPILSDDADRRALGPSAMKRMQRYVNLTH
ncbi:dipeptide ABC transporter ATP-binding protein [Nitratireductor sp. StC3]|uniref:ABC transporter ATP-binding protein n=1 Tax=Nitratireductor sp. StC3 TaxID=2126741 RepID=UPI000D0E2CE1|nr:dipeptide ABC transporter ATP-binding protein [Nitratireductor sp. StC3]PSM16255.1 peptide ABC transporter substrate-binding protein [Nitratireductor sp. StC3]